MKKILLIVLSLLLVAAIIVAVSLTPGAAGEPVNVFSFNHIGMTEYWGDSQESYGHVQTDKVQTVFLSNTQTVTGILVSVGDQVKKGDVLMTFDTTLSDLALEKKRLDVEKVKLQLQEANEELKRIRGMKPMVIPDPPEETKPNLGTALTAPYKISTHASYDGSNSGRAMICWLNSSTAISDEIFAALQKQAEVLQNLNEKAPSSASAPDEPTEYSEPTPTETSPASPSNEEGGGENPGGGNPGGENPGGENPGGENPGGDPEPPTDPNPTEPEPTDPEPVKVDNFYVVFKVTSGNMSLGDRLVWQGAKVICHSDGSYSFTFFDASAVPDHMAPAVETPEAPQIDFGSGFTSSQIAQMRAQQEKVIKDLEFNIRMAEAEYKIMQTEVNDGKVRAEVDGTVVSLLSEEEAQSTGDPFIKVSGGGGFYVEGSISELNRDDMAIGSEVTVNDWRSGMVYTGTIQSIGDYPSSQNSWNGMGNPTATYYPFTVFVEESADLQSGSYVNITYSAGSTQSGIYLENPFLRTESGRSFVYVKGADGNLEKRFVTVGKSLWGSYTEILSGITAEDFLAFPYGPTVKPGAPAVEADIQALYE